MPIQFLMQPYYYRLAFYVQEERVHPIRVLKRFPFQGCGMGDNPTPEELKDFENMRDECYRNWENSGIRASVIAELEKISVEKLNRVTKIIGFACGSLWEFFRKLKKHPYGNDNLLRVEAQHAVIKEMQAYIEKRCGHPVQIYAQDPAYTPQDEEKILKPLHIKRLEDPEGFLEIDDTAIVFAVQPCFSFLQVVADITEDVGPAMIIHSEVEKDAPWEEYKVALQHVETEWAQFQATRPARHLPGLKNSFRITKNMCSKTRRIYLLAVRQGSMFGIEPRYLVKLDYTSVIDSLQWYR